MLRSDIVILSAALFAAAAHGQEPAPSAAPATPAQDVVQPPAKDKFRVYLLMGQSNMAGRAALPPGAPKTNPRVLAMAPDGQWVLAKDPLHEKVGRTEPGVGPGVSFAEAMLEGDPSITIGLVPCAVGGTPLKRWVKGGDLYERAVERAKLASQTGAVSGVLWHQGESDADQQAWAESYGVRLAKMISDLRQDLGEPGMPVVVGQIGEFLDPGKHPYADNVRAALKNIPSEVAHTGYADSAGLTDKGDKLHFDTAAQQQLGARYAEAMQQAGK